MGWAIVADQPRAIHAKDGPYPLQRDIVHQSVIGALQKGRIDGEDRVPAFQREDASE